MQVVRFVGAVALSVAVLPGAGAQGLVNPATEKKIDALLAQMTIEEKVGQLNQYSSAFDVTGPAPSAGDQKVMYDQIRQGLVGSVLNVTGAEATRKMQQLAVENSRLKIPMIFGLDVIHGYRTHVPRPARRGGELGPGGDRAVRPHRGHRGRGGRRPLDVRADGGHRPRRPLGAHHGGRGRGRLPRLPGGGRAGEGLPGQGPLRPRHDRRLRQALRGLRLRRGRTGLQHGRHLRAHPAQRRAAALQGRGRGRGRDLHELVQRDRRDPLHRERTPPARHPQRASGASRASWCPTGARSGR